MIKNKKETKKIKRGKIISPIKRKILLLLEAGIVLGFARSSKRQKKIFNIVRREWKNIDRQYLYRIVEEFHKERLLDFKDNANGSTTILLSEHGKEKILEFKINEMKIKKPSHWDGKWRVVFFDIPEKRRRTRDMIRCKLKELEFYEYQKSVFIHPFPCLDEINFLIEFFDARNFVRSGELTNLTNDAELKLFFKIL